MSYRPYPMPEQHFDSDGQPCDPAGPQPADPRATDPFTPDEELPMPRDERRLFERHSYHQRSTDRIEANVGGQEMSKRLEVPADLEHLIEKRDEEKDRRGDGRRSSGRAAVERRSSG